MKTHFDPHTCEDEYADKYPCGTTPSWEEYKATGDWDKVTCKLCLKSKDKLDSERLSIEKEIVNQMGDMAEKMA